ncbi:DUF6327 family protein [Flavobacterium sp. MK4S-17]|jgi:hypothetical protein|uniref:DUF6327 family protein n=1 Tax=Flavobacterium sp. MK4S-17 TaxID=2543737 RepID=UPI00135B053F|nr:DUF6327 family protein [Flavobacterium sp. MK4S-17]
MNYKEYSTFDQINKDLEIMKVEKDLAYQKFLRELDETKESLEMKNLLGKTPKKILGMLGMLSGPIKSVVLTYLFKKIF